MLQGQARVGDIDARTQIDDGCGPWHRPFSLAVATLASGDRWTTFAQVRGKAPAAAATADVDVELIIAVDVSYSMDPDEQALQREGYITGLNSPEFLNALHQGTHGKIAMTYFEWAGAADQRSSCHGG